MYVNQDHPDRSPPPPHHIRFFTNKLCEHLDRVSLML